MSGILFFIFASCHPLKTSNLTNQTNLECIVFLKIPLSLDWSAQMRWNKDHSVDY